MPYLYIKKCDARLRNAKNTAAIDEITPALYNFIFRMQIPELVQLSKISSSTKSFSVPFSINARYFVSLSAEISP